MTPPPREELHEALRLRLAWEELVAHLMVATDPERDNPRSLYLVAQDADRERLIALLYGHHIGDTFDEAEQILDEVLVLAVAGRQPRSIADFGFTPEDFA